MISFILLQKVPSPNGNLYSHIYFNFFINSGRAAALEPFLDERPLLERLTGLNGNESSGDGIMVYVAV